MLGIVEVIVQRSAWRRRYVSYFGFIVTISIPVCFSNRGLSFIVYGINFNQIRKGKFAKVHLVSFSSIYADYFYMLGWNDMMLPS